MPTQKTLEEMIEEMPIADSFGHYLKVTRGVMAGSIRVRAEISNGTFGLGKTMVEAVRSLHSKLTEMGIIK